MLSTKTIYSMSQYKTFNNIILSTGISSLFQCMVNYSTSRYKTDYKNRQDEISDARIELYKSIGACHPEVLRLAGLQSCIYGHESEKILQNVLGLSPRIAYNHDGIFQGQKIEIKSARYQINQPDLNYCWTRIYTNGLAYDWLILALLNIRGFDLWALHKKQIADIIKSRSQHNKNLTRPRELSTVELSPRELSLRELSPKRITLNKHHLKDILNTDYLVPHAILHFSGINY